MIYIGKELKRYRLEFSDLSQGDLANLLGLSRTLVNKIENGTRNPDLNYIMEFSKLLKLDCFDQYKLQIMAGYDLEIEKGVENKRLVLKLLRFLRKHGLVEANKKLILQALNIFDKSSEFFSLLSSLHLQENDFTNSENYAKLAIKNFDETTEFLTLGGLEHNLGNVYFERGLSMLRERDLTVINKLLESNQIDKIHFENSDFINKTKEAVEDFKQAEKYFLSSLKKESFNDHILQQLARLYFNIANTYERKFSYYKKSEKYYNLFLSSTKNIGENDKLEAGVFLSIIKAKLNKIDSALDLINLLINYRPNYSLLYYAKTIIYLKKQVPNSNDLKLAFENLEKAINLNPSLKFVINNDLELIKLRFSETYYQDFKLLVS